MHTFRVHGLDLSSRKRDFKTLFVTMNLDQFQCLILPVIDCRNHSIAKHEQTVFCIPNIYLFAGKATVSGDLTLTPLVAHENNSCEQLAPVSDTLFASQGCTLMRTSAVLKINCERFKPTNEVTFLIFSSLTLMLFCHMISKRKLDQVERLERMFKDVWVWYPV